MLHSEILVFIIHRKIYKRYTETINLTLLRTGFFGGQ